MTTSPGTLSSVIFGIVEGVSRVSGRGKAVALTAIAPMTRRVMETFIAIARSITRDQSK